MNSQTDKPSGALVILAGVILYGLSYLLNLYAYFTTEQSQPVASHGAYKTAFVFSIVGASLFVSGIVIYILRKKKK